MFTQKINWFEGTLEFKLTKQNFPKAKILEVFDERGKIEIFKYKRILKAVHKFENSINEIKVDVKDLKIKHVAITWSSNERKMKIFINGKKLAENQFYLKPLYIG